jgi:threonine/homoserine/homoserine lactone efflux protein
MHTAFATVGLSALLAQSATAFSVVKYVGAAYLVYLGVRTLLSKEGFTVPRGAPPAPLAKIFFQSVATDVLNPKVALFFLAFLPQFVDPSAGPVAPQMLVLGVLLVGLGTLTDGTYALVAAGAGNRLRATAAARRTLDRVSGGVFIALGLVAALAGEPRRT